MRDQTSGTNLWHKQADVVIDLDVRSDVAGGGDEGFVAGDKIRDEGIV
jgi:hypothetical protein